MVPIDHSEYRPFRRDGIVYRLSNLDLVGHLEQPRRDEPNHLEHLAFSFISFMFARAASRSLFISLPFSFHFSATQWQGKEQKKKSSPSFVPFSIIFVTMSMSFEIFFNFSCTQCKGNNASRSAKETKHARSARKPHPHTKTETTLLNKQCRLSLCCLE